MNKTCRCQILKGPNKPFSLSQGDLWIDTSAETPVLTIYNDNKNSNENDNENNRGIFKTIYDKETLIGTNKVRDIIINIVSYPLSKQIIVVSPDQQEVILNGSILNRNSTKKYKIRNRILFNIFVMIVSILLGIYLTLVLSVILNLI